jgi:hypothetical protein
MEHGDERRLLARAEGLHGLLVRLVGGVARDRERLEPAMGDARRREDAERCEEDPHADDQLAVAVDDMSEARQHA